MSVVLDGVLEQGDIISVEDNLAIRMEADPIGYSLNYVAETRIKGNLNRFERYSANASLKFFYKGFSEYFNSNTAIFRTIEDGTEVMYFVPTNPTVEVAFTTVGNSYGTYISTDNLWSTLSIDNTHAGGSILFQYDIDFTLGSGVISFLFDLPVDANVQSIGTVTVTDKASLYEALEDSSLNSEFPMFVIGDKLFVKPAINGVALATCNSSFLTNGTIVVDNGMALETPTLVIGDLISGVSDKLTLIPDPSPNQSDFDLFVTTTFTGVGAGDFTTIENIPTISRADLGTSAVDAVINSSPIFQSIVRNDEEGLVIQLDQPYFVAINALNIGTTGEDYLHRVGLLYNGDTKKLLIPYTPKPENEIEAQSSESEIVYYIPTDSSLSFTVYNEVEGAGNTLEVKQYSGSEVDVITALEADGFVLDKTNAPVIGINPPSGNEIVVYEETGVILQNYYFVPSTIYLEQLTQGQELFLVPEDNGGSEYSVRLAETFNVPKKERWSEVFSVSFAEFDQVAITTSLVTELQGSSNLSNYTVTGYGHYLGIKY